MLILLLVIVVSSVFLAAILVLLYLIGMAWVLWAFFALFFVIWAIIDFVNGRYSMVGWDLVIAAFNFFIAWSVYNDKNNRRKRKRLLSFSATKPEQHATDWSPLYPRDVPILGLTRPEYAGPGVGR